MAWSLTRALEEWLDGNLISNNDLAHSAVMWLAEKTVAGDYALSPFQRSFISLCPRLKQNCLLALPVLKLNFLKRLSLCFTQPTLFIPNSHSLLC